MTEIEFEELMESRGLPESDREELRAHRDLLSLRAEYRRTRTDEARERYRSAIAKASRP